MAMITIGFILLGLVLPSHGQVYQPRDITNAEFLQYYISGAALSYQIDVKKCQPEPGRNNITLYSFSEDIDHGYVTVIKDAQWEMNFGVERQVNGQRLNLTGPAFRYTGFSLDNTGEAIIGFNDVNPVNNKNLAQAEIYCHMDQGDTSGLRIVATSPPGTALANFVQLQTAVNVGYSLYYAIDIYRCKPVVSTSDHQWIAGRLTGTRYDPDGNIVFTVQTTGLGFITVFNVKVKPDNSVTIKLYVYSKASKSSFENQDKNCTLGTQDTVRIFRQ
ncbi:hypothetical protein SNE40_011076 [Patella caerulea]|uniref:Uncharacterized protein n=1 Tax=Patella caerulea TaxID=87958 RepID=A0AAN8JVM2_PATCE